MPDAALTNPEREAVAKAMHYAVELHNRGFLDQADGLYTGVLKLAPDHVEALHFLGVLRNQQGRVEEALALISSALALNAGWLALLVNYALVLNGAGYHAKALATTIRALTLDPASIDALFQNGNALMGLGRTGEASAAFERILALRPDHLDAMVNAGNALLKLGQPEQALDVLTRAVAAAPDHAGIVNNYGQGLVALDRHAEAVAYFERALTLDPLYAPAMINRAEALLHLDRAAEALDGIDDALAQAPRHAAALNVRGLALAALGRHEEAVAVFDAITAITPDWAHAYNNRGSAQAALNRFAAARASFRIATEIEPDLAAAHTNEAIASLALGDFAAGWAKYEWRWAKPRTFAAPLWRGEEPLAGKTLLIYPEQGFGDTLQCVRYAALAAARGARVVAEVELPLKSVLAGVAGIAELVGEGEALPSYDLRCPMMSLPGAFATTLATIPADVPYVAAPADRLDKWKALLPAAGRLRVGLVFAGNSRHRNDRNRSIPLARLAPLLALDRIAFVSLQTGIDAEDRARLASGPSLLHLGDALGDFADTAAVIAGLDLVVTVDTATAHLAGAMGKPVWIMLPFSPDWRWLLGRRDSPWYPTARLFRQPAAGDWESVIAQVMAELPPG
jgi:tetratricopeptide (TPR) repeat protein